MDFLLNRREYGKTLPKQVSGGVLLHLKRDNFAKVALEPANIATE